MIWLQRLALVTMTAIAVTLGCRLDAPDAVDYVPERDTGTSTGLASSGSAPSSSGEGTSSGSAASNSEEGTSSDSTTSSGSTTSTGSTTSSDTTTTTTGELESTSTDPSSSTGDPVVCGDNIADPGEDCDNADLGGSDCESLGLGFAGGTLACAADCTYDLSACSGCGNDVVQAGEACDGLDLAGESCPSFGFDAGALACAADCSTFDTSGCGSCGNTAVEAGEECDDGAMSLLCDSDCTFVLCGDGLLNEVAGEQCDDGGDSASCDGDCTAVVCGDGWSNAAAGEACDDAGISAWCDGDCTIVECGDAYVNALAGEACEGDDLVGASCVSLGFDVGTLGCSVCAYDTDGCYLLPEAPVLALSFSPVKRFDFSWAAVAGADYYQLLESAAPGEPFVPLGGDVVGTSVSHERPLHLRHQASYVLRACNGGGCTESAVVDVVGSLAEAVGYVKASNTGAYDEFGVSVALSGDGNTLAIGARVEDGAATGIDGDQLDESAADAGAVYVLVRDAMGLWSQQAYIKASNTGAGDGFGHGVALSHDGSTLVVGAPYEAGNAAGIDGNQTDDSMLGAGAAYVFVRDPMGQWSQQAYVKASNTGPGDEFGRSVALSGDGDTLAVSAPFEDSNATGVDGDQGNELAFNTGALYVFARDPMGQWSQQAYVKASIVTGRLGSDLALSADGDTLAAVSPYENGATGAAYVFVRDVSGQWSQQARLLASNAIFADYFGWSVALSGDGDTLAVGAFWEDSSATGIDGNQADNSASNSGAAYVFVRDASDQWGQQAYVKASNTQSGVWFGLSLALDGDGDVLVVGAGVSGVAYVFVRNSLEQWAERASVTASNAGAGDGFVGSVGSIALSSDGNTLAIGASGEDGGSTGIGGNQLDDTSANSGAAYLY